jgi:putative exporter of polyketide antibiotics
MAPSSRDRISVDLRGLKAVLMARAHDQRVSLSVLVRGAVARDLGLADAAERYRTAASVGVTSSAANVKLSIRLTPEEASLLAAGARAAGLSRGAYLAGLMANCVFQPIVDGISG